MTATHSLTEGSMKCWNCGHDKFEAGGQDDSGQEITMCARCSERQEEE